MNIKEIQSAIVEGMEKWEKIEDSALVATSRVIEKTTNPFIRLVMEVIQRDTAMHHRIQEWIAHSLSQNAPALTYDDLNQVWELIEHHMETERQMVDMVKAMILLVEGKRMVMQEYLLNLLLDDENKHANLLCRLEEIKKGLLP